MTNRKIIEYTLVSWDRHTNGDSFEEIINKMISEGWQPLGGVAVDNTHIDCFYQALVRYRDDNEQ